MNDTLKDVNGYQVLLDVVRLNYASNGVQGATSGIKKQVV